MLHICKHRNHQTISLVLFIVIWILSTEHITQLKEVYLSSQSGRFPFTISWIHSVLWPWDKEVTRAVYLTHGIKEAVKQRKEARHMIHCYRTSSQWLSPYNQAPPPSFSHHSIMPSNSVSIDQLIRTLIIQWHHSDSIH